MRIVDTHLHLVYLDKFSYPWLDGVPALKKQWTFESYWAEAQKLGIETALHMEVDVAEQEMEDEARFVLDVDPHIGGAIAAARPEHVDFPRHLERLAAMPGVKGIRRILHTQPDELSQGTLFADNLRRLPAHNLTFDLCVLARQLPIGRELVAKCPDTQFVLDHCGVPDVASQALDPWRDDIRRLAELPNVVAKISGIVAYAKPDWSVDDLRPFVEHVIDSFGWDRVVWGSDHPVCVQTANLTRWVEATRTLINGASEAEQAKLLHGTAERLYRLRPLQPKRYGSILGLKPEAIAEYKRIHDAVWPKVLKQIKDSNISNYSIYLKEPENLLFAYLEYSGTNYAADMARMAENPATQAWWKICMPMQAPLDTRKEGEWWSAMEEVFHVD
jgi:predicted TIM-barrel fold metal-dependent hydrolase/L-rhamnose mutarotase